MTFAALLKLPWRSWLGLREQPGVLGKAGFGHSKNESKTPDT
jgi:hypothetical protein